MSSLSHGKDNKTILKFDKELISWLNKYKLADHQELLTIFIKENLKTVNDVRSLRCCDDVDLRDMGMKEDDRILIVNILEKDEIENPKAYEEFHNTDSSEEEEVGNDESESEIDESRGMKKRGIHSERGMSKSSEMICRIVFLIVFFGGLGSLIMYLMELENTQPNL